MQYINPFPACRSISIYVYIYCHLYQTKYCIATRNDSRIKFWTSSVGLIIHVDFKTIRFCITYDRFTKKRICVPTILKRSNFHFLYYVYAHHSFCSKYIKLLASHFYCLHGVLYRELPDVVSCS